MHLSPSYITEVTADRHARALTGFRWSLSAIRVTSNQSKGRFLWTKDES